jgi:hypothetical protein
MPAELFDRYTSDRQLEVAIVANLNRLRVGYREPALLAQPVGPKLDSDILGDDPR